VNRIKNIRAKFLIAAISGLIAVVSLVLVSDAIHFERNYKKALTDRSLTIARGISSAVANIDSFPPGSREQVNRMVKEILDNNLGVSYSYITDRNGRMVYHTGLPPSAVSADAGPAVERKMREGECLTRQAGDEYYESIVPIRGKKGLVGFAHVGIEKNLIDSQIRNMAFQGGLILALSAVITACLLNTLFRRLVKEPAHTAAAGSSMTNQWSPGKKAGEKAGL